MPTRQWMWPPGSKRVLNELVWDFARLLCGDDVLLADVLSGKLHTEPILDVRRTLIHMLRQRVGWKGDGRQRQVMICPGPVEDGRTELREDFELCSLHMLAALSARIIRRFTRWGCLHLSGFVIVKSMRGSSGTRDLGRSYD